MAAGGRRHPDPVRSTAPTVCGASHAMPPSLEWAARSCVAPLSIVVRQTANTVPIPRPAATNDPAHASESSGHRTGVSTGRMAGIPLSSSTILAPGAIAPGTRRSGSQATGPGGCDVHPASVTRRAAVSHGPAPPGPIDRAVRIDGESSEFGAKMPEAVVVGSTSTEG